MANFLQNLTGLLRKSSTAPDWGTLERYLSWAVGGGTSASGVVVSPQTAMQSAAVYSSIKVLAESIGMLPLNIYRKETNNSRTLLSDHPLQVLCHDQPNDWMTSVEFWEMMVISLNLRGNAYAFINRNRSGQVVELLPLQPDTVQVEMSSDFQLEYQVSMPNGAKSHLLWLACFGL